MPEPNDRRPTIANPYAAPPETGEPPIDGLRDVKHYKFLPLNLLTYWIQGLMLTLCTLYLLSSLISTIGGLMYPTFFNVSGETTTELEYWLAMANYRISQAYSVFVIPLGIIVCVFMRRANTNLRSRLAVGLSQTPGMTALYWFIPILNWFRPYQGMKEIYQCSARTDRPSSALWKAEPVPGTFKIWWTFWLIAGIFNRIIEMFFRLGIELGAASIPADWATSIFATIAGLCLVSIVKEINNRQQAWEDLSLEANPT